MACWIVLVLSELRLGLKSDYLFLSAEPAMSWVDGAEAGAP